MLPLRLPASGPLRSGEYGAASDNVPWLARNSAAPVESGERWDSTVRPVRDVESQGARAYASVIGMPE